MRYNYSSGYLCETIVVHPVFRSLIFFLSLRHATYACNRVFGGLNTAC